MQNVAMIAERIAKEECCKKRKIARDTKNIPSTIADRVAKNKRDKVMETETVCSAVDLCNQMFPLSALRPRYPTPTMRKSMSEMVGVDMSDTSVATKDPTASPGPSSTRSLSISICWSSPSRSRMRAPQRPCATAHIAIGPETVISRVKRTQLRNVPRKREVND